MVELVESIPDHEEIQKGSVQYHYAFALNRRNKKGDRTKAVGILEKVSYYVNELVSSSVPVLLIPILQEGEETFLFSHPY